ncbi:MAG: HAMP domain-containing protein [Alphaproteobacteria bacterium]|nr:HAMP domain-containing protein [Alphaproteobacteria bacterium]
MLKSFSFRIGLLFFALSAALLMGLRIFSYQQTIVTEEQEIRQIIQAHEDEIEHGIDRDGQRYATYLVDALTGQPDDKHLILAMKSGGKLHGNLKQWPAAIGKADGWYEAKVLFGRRTRAVDALVLLRHFKGGHRLLVGYDLARLEATKKALVPALIRDVWISVFAALLLTLLLLFLISRRLETVNEAYRHVMAGEIDFRVKDDGSRDEFAQLSQNFNDMMDWVASLISTLQDSTNSIAHDLRTPLARMRLRLQQMEQQPGLDAARHAALAECIEDIDQLTDIFNGILRIAKAEDLSIAREFDAVDLRRMLEDLADYYGAYLEGEGQGIALDLPAHPLYALGDRHLLSQGMANLIGNASKYGGAGGRISLSLKPSARQKGMVEMTVSDKGPGIPAEFRERVKERFFRMDASRNSPGLGLGLNLADAVVRLHRGKLLLEDNAPGLRCVVLLPELPHGVKPS